jgi:hypothetical protein
MPPNLGQTIAQVPDWLRATQLCIPPLRSKVTNQNFLMDHRNGAYALHSPEIARQLVGINRNPEHVSVMATGKLGIVPNKHARNAQ